MYIYELPYPTNKELCRLLDNDDDWRELAGVHMKYSPFDISEIEQEARRLITSPTNQLFVRWGQQNHTVESLFILLHRMVHVPAMRLLVPLLDNRFHKLLMKHSVDVSKEKDTAVVDENANRQMARKINESVTSIPLPVMLIENGVQMPTSSSVVYMKSPSESTTENDTPYSREHQSALDNEFMRSVAAIPVLSYEDLVEATDNWSERNLLGRGGFGHVYKGEWKQLPVAVKRLRDNDGKCKELIREMCLNQYRHDNILPLYGYSLGGPEACLVYQLMSGGSLEQRLRGKAAPLTWGQRRRVAHGVARGLLYLHTMAGTPLIHGDIKPANILLDPCSVPKIGDFGLARKGPYGEERTHLKVSRVHGTRPYLPEEYLRSRHLSPAVDVFSFGVVLVETASALPALDRACRAPLLSDLVQAEARDGVDFATLEDRKLKDTPHSSPQLTRDFVNLGVECTRPHRHERPAMLHVYRRLDAMMTPEKSQPY